VRRGGAAQELQQPLWLVQIAVRDSSMQPWLLVTDWPVTDEQSALRILRMYRQRWAVDGAQCMRQHIANGPWPCGNGKDDEQTYTSSGVPSPR